MIWIAPSEKDTDNAALEKRLWDAAEQAVPAPHFAEADRNSARPEGLPGLIFLRFAETDTLQWQIQNLRRMRDQLLPRLLSGNVKLT